MSHFTVLVIGDEAEEQLAPFQENNMGDTPEEYLKFESRQKEMEEEYAEEDAETKAKYPTLELYATEYHGYEKDEATGEYGYITNPNAKWDWYELGGRWTGFFKLKKKDNNGWSLNQDHVTDLSDRYGVDRKVIKKLALLINSDMEAADKLLTSEAITSGYRLKVEIQELITLKYNDAKVGRPGLMTEIAGPGYVDSARVQDIDFEGMIMEAGAKAKDQYELVERLLGGIPKLEYHWKDIIAKDSKFSSLDIDAKRNLYHNQDAKKLVFKVADDKSLTKDERSLLIWLDLENYQVSKEEFVKKAENNAISTFAVLKDGGWHERGEMGWFGVAHNEKDEGDWNAEFMKLLRGLPGDTLISVYDCHI